MRKKHCGSLILCNKLANAQFQGPRGGKHFRQSGALGKGRPGHMWFIQIQVILVFSPA